MTTTPASHPATTRDILATLVSFNVLSRQSNLALIEWIEQFLDAYGVTHERIASDDGERFNLLARIGPNVAGGVVLSGHTDVVPVEGQAWQSDPFTLTERDGRLYGRGSCDMKGFLACALAGVPDWCQQDLKRPIWLAFSYDEEIGCLGAPRMIEHLVAHHPRPDAVIVGEPTLMAPVILQKGITTLRTTVHGVPAHSSQVNQGISAIHVAARLISRIEDIMSELAEEGHLNDAFNVPHSSLHVGTIEGGNAINIMAQRCAFEWEIRHLPEEGFEAVYARFREYSDELEETLRTVDEGFAIETRALTDTVPGLEHRNNDQALALLERLGVHEDGQAVAYATEAGQFQQAGLQAIICGPGSIEQAHRADEFISLEQLDRGAHFMQTLGEIMAE
ncbi:acetylornithine deacetylase [Kushneria pakistanensis]|uniref:Acetylornithine deacetylase n=1 Tax=Kushneria pakistanensis TaxID=1508770 RepID=A0ABQ3FBE4_9GAMM|nr:acetylornithine deacetylase [Kushneria pakistanensis]GHC17162.1 acetylornithine deacetylase [Kushneria pakistanensis]